MTLISELVHPLLSSPTPAQEELDLNSPTHCKTNSFDTGQLRIATAFLVEGRPEGSAAGCFLIRLCSRNYMTGDLLVHRNTSDTVRGCVLLYLHILYVCVWEFVVWVESVELGWCCCNSE